tara:strand:- start:639 stop:926 length:288 start_codon:yes stop_codon:yes gene_type:complete
MSEAIMKHQSKRAKKSAKVVNYARMVVEVDESMPSKQILYLLNTSTTIQSKSGRVPQCYIPTSTTSLGLILKGSPYFEMLPYNNNKSHHVWRRLE